MVDEDTSGAGRRSVGAQRSQESAEAILEAAQQVLSESGYAGFSIEAVARRARAGKPTIYRWWPSKTALLLDVYQRQKRDVVYPDTGSVEEDLFLFMVSLFRQWRETPTGNIFRSILAEAQSDPETTAALSAYSEARRQNTGQIIVRALSRGEVKAGTDPKIVADLASSYAWSHLLTDRLNENEDTIRQAVRILVHGIRA